MLTALSFPVSAIEKRIIGGGRVSTPWVVKITHGANVHCSGTIIASQWIITAAHCFFELNLNPNDLQLAAGGNGQIANLELLPAIEEIYLHPQYTGTRTVARDVALIKLVAPIKFSHSLYAIPIRNVAAFDFHDQRVSIAGWGSTGALGTAAAELRGFSTPLFRTEFVKPDTAVREVIYRNLRGPGILAYIGSSNITCGGDSGTGWTLNLRTEGPQLIAVHSQGDCHSFGAATELSDLIPWIRSHLEKRL